MKRLSIVTGLVALTCTAPLAAEQRSRRAPGNIVEGVDFTRRPGQPPIEETYPDTRGMPRDVQAYIIRWSDCRHWQGEYSEDPTRAAQIRRGQREACAGVDRLGTRIRARYARNRAVIARIRDYEPMEN